MAAPATKEQVSIRILVDEEKNKVLFVQAGKDFVDVLLSFLTLPLGTIARLLSHDSNLQKVSVGSISSLYESVANLDEKHFWTRACKEVLLRPRNSMEEYCQNLKLNIDDTEKTKYFICENWECSRKSNSKVLNGGLLSTFRNQKCSCGKPMNQEISHASLPANKGFVPETTTFIILDDLNVKPDNFQNTICLPKSVGYEDVDAFKQVTIKQVTVNVTQKEILDLLKCSLLSATPLTDVFLMKKQFLENAQPISVSDFDIGDVEADDEGKTIKVKVMVRKSNNAILFALGEEDFADFVLSFLTFPMGGVEHMLNGNSNIGSIDNLYKSLLDLDPYRYLRSPDLKHKLEKTRLAHQFKLRNQILPIDEVPTLNSFCVTKYDDNNSKYSGYLSPLKNYKLVSNEVCAELSYLEPQSSTGEAYSKYDGNGRGLPQLTRERYGKCGRGFTKSPSLYMVSDDLDITPGSSASTISFLTKLGIPPSDLEERVINIGKKEGLSLMRASLMSSSALTNGLGPFLKTKNESIPN